MALLPWEQWTFQQKLNVRHSGAWIKLICKMRPSSRKPCQKALSYRRGAEEPDGYSSEMENNQSGGLTRVNR